MTTEPTGNPREHLWGPPIRRTLLLATIVLGTIAAGVTIAVAEPSITFGTCEIGGVTAIGAWLLTHIEVAVWKVEHIWDAPTIRRLVRRSARGRLWTLPIVAFLGFYVESSPASDTLFAVGAFAFVLSRIRLTLRLRTLISALPPDHAEDDTVPVSGDTVAVPPVIGECADRKIRSFRSAIASLLRRQLQIAATCLLTLAVGFALTGIGDGLGWDTGTWSRHHSGTSSKKGSGHAKTVIKGSRSKGGNVSGGNGNSESTGNESEETAPCEAIPAQHGVPRQVLSEIQSLYAGRQELGPAQTGCPKEVYEESTPEGVLFWVLGKARRGKAKGEAKSLVVIPPKRFRNAIVLRPAIVWVEQIIKEGHNVGGPRQFPRYYIGGGDIYVLDTEQGSIILAQEETGTVHQARALVSLPVSASYAFLSLTSETEVWHWPMEPQKIGHGFEVFKLKRTGRPFSKFRIVYNTASKTATRNGESTQPDPYTAREQQFINPNELRRCAPPPPLEERQREEAEETSAEIHERQEDSCSPAS